MKTKDFLRKHEACSSGAKWALSISDDMADVWDAMIKDGKYAWLIWTLSRPGVFPWSVLLQMACRFVRETPLMDGLVVWDLLADERSRKAVEVTEAYADGKATDEELRAARVSAYAAYCAVYEAADYPASRAAYAVAYPASRAAYAAYAAVAYADAYAAYAAAAYAGDAAYAAYAVAYPASRAAYAAYADAAYAGAYAAAYAGDAAYAADADAYSAADSDAYAHAKAAQIKMIAEISNPFRKGQEDE